MADIQLKVTITRLAKFEEDTGIGIAEAFDQSGKGKLLSSLVKLVKACSDATDDDIDEYVAEHGFDQLADDISASMEKSGFLGKQAAPKEAPAKA